MSAAETLGGINEAGLPHVTDLSLGLTSTAYEDMLDSIERTALYSPRSPYLPLISSEALAEGNARVVRAKDQEQAGHITVVGHDAFKFEGEEAVVLSGFRSSELMGLMLLVRGVVAPAEYKRLGFFPEALNEVAKSDAITKTLAKLAGIKTTNGTSLVTRVGSRRLGRAGIDSFTVSDVRHTNSYKEARRKASLASFEEYLKSGGGSPGLFERPTIEAARLALRGFAGSGMTDEQRGRFKRLSRETADTLSHRTDVYEQSETMSSRAAYERVRVADEFEPIWQSASACGPETHHIFFPPGTFERKEEKLNREARAKEICRSCPILVDCLEDALERREPFGVWGGLNESERKEIKIRRASTY